jgi:hypothetical protein
MLRKEIIKIDQEMKALGNFSESLILVPKQLVTISVGKYSVYQIRF